MILELPWPPSNNVYYRHIKMGMAVRSLISQKGRDYNMAVKSKVCGNRSFGSARLSISVIMHPPDKRKRDLDNFMKALLDGLKGSVFDDDEQVDKLSIERGDIVKGGMMVVEIQPMDGDETCFATKIDILNTGLF